MTYIVHVQSLSEIMKMHINELASALALHSWLPLLHLGHSIDQCTPEVVVGYIMQNLCLKISVACMSLLWFRNHRSVCILSIFFLKFYGSSFLPLKIVFQFLCFMLTYHMGFIN